MHIRLREGGGILDLKPDASLNITMNNPMLTEQGSMSLPLSLPNTADNKRYLGTINLQSAYKYQRNRDITLEAGIFQKPALLRMASGSKDMEATIYLEESPMYARMKEMDMDQAFDITVPASSFYVPGTFDSDLDMMIKYMELVMVGNIQHPHFYLFPVATDYYTQTVTISGENREFTFHQLLNEQMSSTSSAGITDTDMNNVEYYMLAGRNARQYREGDRLINVPVGYGITPFLKQSYILRRIFAFFGYDLQESIFDTDPEMQKIAVLNNTADAICASQLRYSHLVPSVKISDYLQSVRDDYGCEFFISPDHKSVIVRFWNDILDNKDYKLLDSKLDGIPIVNLSDSKLIKLTASRSIEFADINFDTLNKFQSGLEVLYEIASFSQAAMDGYYFVRSYGQIWERRSNGSNVTWKYHSQYLFDFYIDKADSVDDDYDTRDSKRDIIPYITAYPRYTGTASAGNFGYQLQIPFIGKRRHLNTSVKTSNKDASGNDIYLDNSSDTNKCPIMTAFYRGRNTNTTISDNSLKVYGNIFRFDSSGIVFSGGFNLVFGGLNGLYSKFWAKYAGVIRDSFNVVKLPLHFDLTDIQNFRFDNIYMIENQPLLPEKLSFSIDRNNKVTVSEAQFRTIKLYL